MPQRGSKMIGFRAGKQLHDDLFAAAALRQCTVTQLLIQAARELTRDVLNQRTPTNPVLSVNSTHERFDKNPSIENARAIVRADLQSGGRTLLRDRRESLSLAFQMDAQNASAIFNQAHRARP